MLPDALTLPLAAGGLLLAWNGPAFVDHILGAVAGFAVFAAAAWAYRRIRGREGLGLGDAKLLAAAGAWVAWQGLASVVFIAAVAGLGVALARAAASGRTPAASDRVPFGATLALGLWLVWL